MTATWRTLRNTRQKKSRAGWRPTTAARATMACLGASLVARVIAQPIATKMRVTIPFQLGRPCGKSRVRGSHQRALLSTKAMVMVPPTVIKWPVAPSTECWEKIWMHRTLGASRHLQRGKLQGGQSHLMMRCLRRKWCAPRRRQLRSPIRSKRQ